MRGDDKLLKKLEKELQINLQALKILKNIKTGGQKNIKKDTKNHTEVPWLDDNVYGDPLDIP